MNSNHVYLELYCEKYGLKITGTKIINSKKKIVANFESIDDKYVFFETVGCMKKSDLFLAVLDNLSVH